MIITIVVIQVIRGGILIPKNPGLLVKKKIIMIKKSIFFYYYVLVYNINNSTRILPCHSSIQIALEVVDLPFQ